MTEDDIHAFVDDALPLERRAEVERFLALNQDAMQRVAAFAAQRTALRAALAPIAAEPIPPALNLAHLIEQQRHPTVSVSSFLRLAIRRCGGADPWHRRCGRVVYARGDLKRTKRHDGPGGGSQR
ncbi:anti-sigma factor family protein [Lichenihabitans psoromatis]|uniref:anti-sigma factor family protein n=1 Tax=Lichenihabitans psoromatis TaxID=2528642 RepID=UPI001036BFC4|nr:hypothetical protein [Lichenihabitans psoromatis]